MNITDETLSAFLDAELSEAEMEAVRARIAEDEQLALRLAELATVDSLVRDTYSAIDQQPMPAAIDRLLAQSPASQPAASDDSAPTIQPVARPFRFPRWAPQWAMAASIAFVAGFGLNQWLSGAGPAAEWRSVAQALDTTPSGAQQAIAGHTLTPRVSFQNAGSQVCRQYQLQSAHQQVQAIACKIDGQWREVVALRQRVAADQGHYQTASGASAINAMVDQMAVGNFFSATQEAHAIETQWARLPDSNQ